MWGSFNYNREHDVLRIDVPVKKNDSVETMAIFFEKVSGGANLNMMWEDVAVILPIGIY